MGIDVVSVSATDLVLAVSTEDPDGAEDECRSQSTPRGAGVDWQEHNKPGCKLVKELICDPPTPEV